MYYHYIILVEKDTLLKELHDKTDEWWTTRRGVKSWRY